MSISLRCLTAFGVLCLAPLAGCSHAARPAASHSVSSHGAVLANALADSGQSQARLVPDRSARLQVVEVTTSGTSMTRDGAVTDALVNAINRVNGVVINEQTLGLSLDAGFRTTSFGSARREGGGATGAGAGDASAGPGSASPPQTSGLSLASGAYAKFMEQETHGAIKSYSILSLYQGKRGTWHAKVRATVSKFVMPQEALRRSIAVLPPKIASGAISIDGSHIGQRQARTFTTQAVVSSLTGTQKFTILDREHTSLLNAELSSIRAGQASISDYALLGKRLVADYVLVTRIDRLHYRVAVTHFIDTSRTFSTSVGGVTVFYELIDPVTAQVVASGTLRSGLTSAQMQQYGSLSTNRSRLQALSSYIGKQVANAISNALFPTMVVDATGNHVVIGEGAGALQAGERYQVFEYGNTIKDPYTGENLGREETLCCTVMISRTTPNLAYGVVSGLTRDFEVIFRPDTFILGSEVVEWNPKRAKARSDAIEKLIKKQNSVFGST